jgi:hypothetical protein
MTPGPHLAAAQERREAGGLPRATEGLVLGRWLGCEAGLRAITSWATVLSCELGRGRGLAGLGRAKAWGGKGNFANFFQKNTNN